MSEQVNVESLARARMALHERIAEEQDELTRNRSKNKLKSKRLKKQAEFANVGSDKKGTIKLEQLNVSLDIQDEKRAEKEKPLTLWDSVLKDLDDE